MKILVAQKELNEHLTAIRNFLPSRPTHPILGNVLIEADEETGEITLTGYDLRMGLQTRFKAQVIEGGRTTLEGKLLIDIISRINGIIEIETAPPTEDYAVSAKIKTDNGNFSISGLLPDEYPNLPTIEGEPIEIPLAEFKSAIAACVPSVSVDETKQVLTGIHLSLTTEGMELAATDGHRLTRINIPSPVGFAEETSLTIPAVSLKEISQLSGNTFNLIVDDGMAILSTEDRKIITRVLDGRYPDYNQLIPKQFSRVVTLGRKALISAVELCNLVADKKHLLVTLSIEEENTVLSASSPTGETSQKIESQLSGNPITLAFNAKYLLEGLKTLSSNEIQIELNEPNTPAIFSPLGGMKMLYLAMPVQIRE